MGIRKKQQEQIYEMEQVLPIVAGLADKYTSKESSSLPYEAASMLTEAVIYTLDECLEEKGQALYGGNNIDINVIYKEGKEIIEKKVYRAKELYEALGADFQDYGCRNYRDAILKGMPAFFLRYDMFFEPQNHLLTMDYPLIYGLPKRCGVDMILEYLQGIAAESSFLSLFPPESIRECLREMSPDFPGNFMDNICYPVLWRAIACFIADCPLQALSLPEKERETVCGFFQGDSREKNVLKIQGILKLVLRKARREELFSYFALVADDYAARLCLDNLPKS